MYPTRLDNHGGFDTAKARQEELRAERAQDRLAVQARGEHRPAPLVVVVTAVTRIIRAGLSALGPGRPRQSRQAGQAPVATPAAQPAVAAQTTQRHGRGA